MKTASLSLTLKRVRHGLRTDVNTGSKGFAGLSPKMLKRPANPCADSKPVDPLV